MERNDRSTKINGEIAEKIAPGPQCENPRQNGTKPALSPKTDEQCKKHIRRDGRK